MSSTPEERSRMNTLKKQLIIAVVAFALSIIFVIVFDTRGTEKEYMQASQAIQEQPNIAAPVVAPKEK